MSLILMLFTLKVHALQFPCRLQAWYRKSTFDLPNHHAYRFAKCYDILHSSLIHVINRSSRHITEP